MIPCYNAEQFIERAVRSVLEQKEVSEIIVVNDGSTDSSQKILDELSWQIPQLNIYIHPDAVNKGRSASRNLGIKKASNPFIAFLDADDYYPNKSLSSRVALFDNEEVNFVDGCVFFCEENLEKPIRKYLPKVKNINPNHELLKLNGSCFMGMSWMIRNNKNIKPFKEEISHCEDLIFFIENSKNGFYSFTEETILKYRQVNHSAMRNLKGLHKGYQYTFNFLVENKFDNNLINTFKSKYLSIMFKSYLKNFHIFEAIKVLLLSK